MHLVGTRKPHPLLVGIVFTTCCFKLRWPLRYKSVMIMSLVQNAKKLKKIFPVSAKSTKAKLHKFWEKHCASPLQSFLVLQACSEI